MASSLTHGEKWLLAVSALGFVGWVFSLILCIVRRPLPLNSGEEIGMWTCLVLWVVAIRGVRNGWK